MAETILIVLTVLVALILAVFVAFLAVFVKNAVPRMLQAKAVLEKVDRLLASAEERRLIQTASETIEEGRSAIRQIQPGLEAAGQVAEKAPALADEALSALSEARALLRRADTELPPEKVRELLSGAQETLFQAKKAAEDLEDLLSKARHTRDTVTDGIIQTKDKVEDAVNLVGALRAGLEAGIRSLRR